MINQQLKRNMERIIILDACALESQEAMEIIESAEKVIVLTGTIRELDNNKNKHQEDQYGINIRYIGKRIRQDTESKKYICISKYEKYKYNDDNIIDYCIWHNEAVILTCDNYLCAKAKAHNIPYIFPKITKEQKAKPKDAVGKEKSKNSSCNVKGVTYKNDKLLILRQVLLDPNVNIIIIRYGKVINFNVERSIELNIGDIIIRVKENNEKVTLAMFEITSIESKNFACNIGSMSLEKPIIESLKKANLPVEVKKQICFLFEAGNYDEGEQEPIYMQNRRIYLKQGIRNAYICLERNGTFIKRQECMEGDLVYLCKSNKKKKSLTLYVYKIVKKLNIYCVEHVEETHSIKSINEIYTLNCSEQVKDKIREFYVSKIKY